MEITNEKVIEALKNVYDPEIPVNVVELGLIYDIKVENDNVHVKMTLTAPGCPMHTVISSNAEKAIKSIPGVKDVKVEVVWEPKWTPDRMSQSSREKLGL